MLFFKRRLLEAARLVSKNNNLDINIDEHLILKYYSYEGRYGVTILCDDIPVLYIGKAVSLGYVIEKYYKMPKRIRSKLEKWIVDKEAEHHEDSLQKNIAEMREKVEIQERLNDLYEEKK